MAFFEFNIAMSGLFAAQRGLQVTSNNITNAATKGYSRQLLSQQASTPLSGLGVGMTGTGVSTTGVNRVRDSYIDQKLWSHNPKYGEYNIKVTQNSMIESAFGEPSDTGFTAVFNNVFNGISNLSMDPSSAENKVVVKEQLVSFAKYYNNIAGTLSNYQQNLNFDLKNTVNEINSLSTRIRSLNEQIMNAEIYGDEASSFRDERDNCLDRLSQIINIDVEETEYQVKGNTVKKLTVKAAGQVLVDHVNCNTLNIEVREEKKQASDVDGLYDIVWSNGLSFDMSDSNMSGELKGLLDMRDGAGTGTDNTYNGIPYYMERLDTYVQKFAKTMNEEYSKTADGFIQINNCTIKGTVASYMKRDDAGNMTFYDENKTVIAMANQADDGTMKIVRPDGTDMGLTPEETDKICNGYSTKYALFTYSTGHSSGAPVGADALTDYSQLTAANFYISKELFDDPTSMRTLYDESNPSDTSFMLNLLAQKDNKHMFKEGDPKDYMVSIFAELGINAKEAEMYQDTQTAVVQNLTNQRLSVSQVDTSEEFTYLIQYQQAYQAAAKVMTTIDEIYETTIFKLGNF
ncbi:MAG: flagellar hook-associated protein FlgK [Cellulosilyticum sp.]|nr:flagellar hook-associated protein FlgK [Cellulosilyticum sp.]